MKIINKKKCYHLDDILDDDFFNNRKKGKGRFVSLFAEGGFGEKVDRVELAELMIKLTNTALQHFTYNAYKKGVRIPIPNLSMDIKPDELSKKKDQWTFYKLKVKVDYISDRWDSFDDGIVSEDD